MNLDTILPLQTIREHSKTDDNPSVTDDLLKLYRDVAFEAAEKYTGMSFTPTRVVTEPVRLKGRRGKIKLSYMPSSLTVTLYGGGLGAPVDLLTKPKSDIIYFPNGSPDNFQTWSDCHTCGLESQLMATYETGRKCESRVPPGIIMGVLKLITWHINHPGDEVLGVRNTLQSNERGLIGGTNNAAVISGAQDEWYRYRNPIV